MINRTYETLDAIAVVGSLVIVGGLLAALCFKEIPQNNLPVIAGIGSAVLAVATAYGAFRWGNSAQKSPATAATTTTGDVNVTPAPVGDKV